MSIGRTRGGVGRDARQIGGSNEAKALADVGAWFVGLALAQALHGGVDSAAALAWGLAGLWPIAVALQLTVGRANGAYLGRWLCGSFDEARALALCIGMTTAGLLLSNLLLPRPFAPTEVTLGAGVATLVVVGTSRALWRMWSDAQLRPRLDGRQRVLVFGAGEGGIRVVRTMLHDPESPVIPVAMLDDDPRKQELVVAGVPVVGTRAELRAAAEAHDATGLLVAVPSGDSKLIRELMALALEAGLDLQVLPSTRELFSGRSRVSDIRPPTDADLLGRHPVETNLDAIRGYVGGKRVLVTGAGGSIGSELCRLVAQCGPAELMMVDRDESALHAVQLSLDGHGLLSSPNIILLDIRDRHRVLRLFADRRPEIVLHAAALKHLPLLQAHPAEALKTNVWGTLAVLEAAAAAGTESFVNISTDKAADPTSILGYSKHITERLTADVGSRGSGTYLSVRFGNVLGSRGSFLTSLRAQIDDGGPVTITDRDVSRYFMTVGEAVSLVLQGGAIGRNGEVLVLDMGEAVRIDDLARSLISRSGRAVEITYTGLRPGEKLEERLVGREEQAVRREHPLIMHVEVPPLHPDLVRHLDDGAPDDAIAARLQRFAVPDRVIDLRRVAVS